MNLLATSALEPKLRSLMCICMLSTWWRVSASSWSDEVLARPFCAVGVVGVGVVWVVSVATVVVAVSAIVSGFARSVPGGGRVVWNGRILSGWRANVSLWISYETYHEIVGVGRWLHLVCKGRSGSVWSEKL